MDIETSTDVFDNGNRDNARNTIRLNKARHNLDLTHKTIVIGSWENELAAAGGVRAVTKAYAEHLAATEKCVYVLTPLHTGLRQAPAPLPLTAIAWVDFEGTRHRVEILFRKSRGVNWVYLHAPGFFGADGGRDGSDPYIYSAENDASPRSPLVRDCLFYSLAAPQALQALGLTENLVLHLQDWVTAGVALTSKLAILRGTLKQAIACLALHNPYDASLTPADWAIYGNLPVPAGAATFLGRFLPFLDGPPATVSREFAIDLVEDPLQTHYFADHLQPTFVGYRSKLAPRGVLGVDNGPFEELPPPFSKAAIANVQSAPDVILEEKRKLRETMMKEAYPATDHGYIDFAQLPPSVSLFFCVGRLDPRQKGFDVAARAIDRVLMKGMPAKFVFAPIPGSVPAPYLQDLFDLADHHRGNVVVFPERLTVGYRELQAGCTFSLWPSTYEPFGGVSEFLSRGTPIVARATGGLRQQITDFDSVTGKGNGILYTAEFAPDRHELEGIFDAVSPLDRLRFSSYESQVAGLTNAISRAVDIYDDGRAYAQLLSNTFDGGLGDNSWKRAAREYADLYKFASEV